MKKFFAILTSVILLMSLVAPVALAEGNCTIRVSASQIQSGDFKASVMIDVNPGFSSLNLTVSFDNSKLELTSVTAGNTLPGNITLSTSQPGVILKDVSTVSCSWAATTDTTSVGTVFSMSFRIKDGDWTTTDVYVSDCEAINGNLSEVSVAVTGATISKPHTHKAGAEWKKDESSHWHECTGEGCGEKMDVAQHSWDNGIVITEATESSKGLVRYTCKVCNATKEKEIPMLQHTHKAGTEWKKDKSSHWHECVGEDCSEKMDVAPHSWNEGVIAQRPSCKNTGIKLFTCTVSGCGATKTEIVAATGHTFDNGTVTTEPTCTSAGVMTFKCTNEGCTETKTEPINALGHKWDEGTVITEPTCTVAGLKSFKCTNKNCDETKTEPVNALGHKWDNGTVTIEPTTTKNGEKTYKCTNAGCTEVKTESIPATGRDYPTHPIPTTPAPPTADMPQTGNTDITMAAIVLILLGGITWIIVSKKKRNN